MWQNVESALRTRESDRECFWVSRVGDGVQERSMFHRARSTTKGLSAMRPRLGMVSGMGSKATGRSRRRGQIGGTSLERLERRALLSVAAPPAGAASPTAEIANGPARHRLVLDDSTTTRVVGETVLRDIVYNKDGESLDLYLPVGQAPPGGWPVVVAFPGGGWRWASKKDYGSRASILTHYGFAVAVADYTYSSGNAGSRAWPADFEDVRAAVVWVREHASRFKIDSTKIAAMGESSGAYMANMIGVYPNGPVSADSLPSGATSQTPPAAGETSAKVAAVVDFYGPTNIPALFQDAPKTRVCRHVHRRVARPSSRSRGVGVAGELRRPRRSAVFHHPRHRRYRRARHAVDPTRRRTPSRRRSSPAHLAQRLETRVLVPKHAAVRDSRCGDVFEPSAQSSTDLHITPHLVFSLCAAGHVDSRYNRAKAASFRSEGRTMAKTSAVLILMLMLMFVARPIDDDRPAAIIAEDWNYAEAMKRVARRFDGREGMVLHVGDSITLCARIRRMGDARDGQKRGGSRDPFLDARGRETIPTVGFSPPAMKPGAGRRRPLAAAFAPTRCSAAASSIFPRSPRWSIDIGRESSS